MKTKLLLLVFGSFGCAFFAIAADTAKTQPDRVSFFEVTLRCPAAPQIGCGSSAKPILLQLEHDSAVSEAWLNRPGTIIAVVWKDDDSTSKVRDHAVATLKKNDAKEIKGASRQKELSTFLSGQGWYRGAEVDRLSEEEAGIIANRLVKRVQAKTSLRTDKADRLRQVLTETFRKMFTEGKGQKALSVEDLAGGFLDPKEIAAVREALQTGFRPLDGEE